MKRVEEGKGKGRKTGRLGEEKEKRWSSGEVEENGRGRAGTER